MKKIELIKHIELTWEQLKEDGVTTMMRIDGSRAPIFLRASDQTVAFLLTMDINRTLDIKPKKFNNVSIQIEKLSAETKAPVQASEDLAWVGHFRYLRPLLCFTDRRV